MKSTELELRKNFELQQAKINTCTYSLEKEHLPEGAWIYEPDTLEFQYKGYECQVFRRDFGYFLYGYIAFEKGDRYYGVDYDSMPGYVHGGWTFSEELEGKWVVGFDCAHAGDYCPGHPAGAVNIPRDYKDIDFVCEQLTNFIDQLVSGDFLIKLEELS